MNRRDLFATIGAAIGAVMLGRNVAAEDKIGINSNLAFRWSDDAVYLGSLNTNSGLRLFPGEDLTFLPEEITRIDGLPILPGSLYIDGNGVIQFRAGCDWPNGFDIYSAWL